MKLGKRLAFFITLLVICVQVVARNEKGSTANGEGTAKKLSDLKLPSANLNPMEELKEAEPRLGRGGSRRAPCGSKQEFGSKGSPFLRKVNPLGSAVLNPET